MEASVCLFVALPGSEDETEERMQRVERPKAKRNEKGMSQWIKDVRRTRAIAWAKEIRKQTKCAGQGSRNKERRDDRREREKKRKCTPTRGRVHTAICHLVDGCRYPYEALRDVMAGR